MLTTISFWRHELATAGLRGVKAAQRACFNPIPSRMHPQFPAQSRGRVWRCRVDFELTVALYQHETHV
jgi:hypothetical protein